jgi:hypothetical protein
MESGEHVPDLCESVVSEWLGGSPDVSTKQALRAMRTWARSYGRPSRREARSRAATIVAAVADSSAMPSDCLRAERTLAYFVYDRKTPAGDKAEQLWTELTARPVKQRIVAAREAVREHRWHEAELLGGEDEKQPAAPLLDAFREVGDARHDLVPLARRFEALHQLDDWDERDLERGRRVWQASDVAAIGSPCLSLLPLLVRPAIGSHRTGGFARRRRVRGA